ncbi:MAG: MFS transporter, partial [Acidimicrobiia bacterium]
SREAKTTDLRSRGAGRALPGFFVICQAGLVTKLADVAAWGLLPLHLRDRGLSIATVGLLSAVYPLAWAAFQPATGWLSDRIGRSAPIAGGLAAQAAGLAGLAASDTVTGWIAAAVVLGAGTALVYPVLLAAAADLAPPEGRAKSVGLYRFWRDLGFVVGGVAGGPVADALGIPASLVVLAAVSLVSMALFLTRSPTTRPGRETSPPPPAPPGRETSPPPPARARNSP